MPFLDPEKFKPKLREVFENVVIPQIKKANMKQEINEFLEKLNALCWEYHIEIKPTHPVPNDEYPTISIINGDEVVKLVYIDGDGDGK